MTLQSAPVENPVEEAAYALPFAPAKVLLVDDRPENLLALEAALEPLGQTLVFASSGEEALKRVLADEFAVVLLDVQMPGLDGFQTAEYMQRVERTRHVPLIFLTALSKDSHQVFRGYSAGAVDYLVKPFEPAVIRSKVAVFVELHYRKKALEASEERFRTAFDNAPIGIALAGMDGRWLQVNRSLCEMTGYSGHELLTKSFDELAHPDDAEPSLDDIGALLADGAASHQVEKRYVRAGGEIVWVLLSVSRVLDPEGRPLHYIVQAEDVTQRRHALDASEERFRTAFDNAPIGIALAGMDGRWLQVNHSLCEMTGYSEDELLAKSFEELAHPDDAEPGLDDIGALLADGAASHQVEKRYVRAGGEVLWVLLSVSRVLDPEGRPLHYIVQAEDVTQRKLAQEELALRALHDPLTGLPNRTLFLDRLEQALARLARGSSSLAVMFVDLDGFKVINDSLGHERGDQLLVEVSQRLRGALRPSDTIGRLGGDEFIVLCEEVADERLALELAERIQDALSAPFPLAGREVFVTASTGIVLEPDPRANPVDIIRDSDAAMYRAKARGRSRCELFDDDTRDRAVKRLATENALHRALERAQLDVFYQSTVEVATGSIVGMEALARWEHPKLGVVPPKDFVPLAEEIGLILPLGTWVLEEACRQWATWRNELPAGPPLTMSVNLSARQLAQPDLVEVVSAAAEAAGMEPSALCLEITESVLLDDHGSAAKGLEDLKGLGVTLAIDDFGTGYSALGYLRRLPVDILKVDRSFVQGLGDDPHAAAVLRAVIDLAHALGMTTVAEGVETAEQLTELERLGCDRAQGYYFDVPRPPEAVVLPTPGGDEG